MYHESPRVFCLVLQRRITVERECYALRRNTAHPSWLRFFFARRSVERAAQLVVPCMHANMSTHLVLDHLFYHRNFGRPACLSNFTTLAPYHLFCFPVARNHDQVTGQPSVLYYADTIFEDVGLSSSSSVLVAAFKLVATLCAVLTVDKHGR